MNGNLLAGTLRSGPPQSQSPTSRNPYLPQRNPYLPPQQTQSPQNAQNVQNGIPPSIATTAMPSTMSYLEKKLHSGNGNASQEKENEREKSKKQHLQGPIDKSSPRYLIEYNHDLPGPWSPT